MSDTNTPNRDEYNQIYATATIRPEYLGEVDRLVARICRPDAWARYVAVANQTQVPAHVIALIHAMECGLNFAGHLHNGDPLSARTVQVPKGRPVDGTPPFTWEQSAVDALTYDKLTGWHDWSIAGICHKLELYNGVGYRKYHPSVKTPYLWSYTTAYSSGKYTADGKWSDSAVSRQAGAMALLKRMIALGKVTLEEPTAAVPAADEPAAVRGLVPKADMPAAPAYPGRVLRVGMRGDDVRALQSKLLSRGIGEVGAVDGVFGSNTRLAVTLFQTRGVDEAGMPLTADGLVGPRTWRALFGLTDSELAPVRLTDAPNPLLGAVLEIAGDQIGVREDPPGSNRGPMIDAYMAAVDPSLRGQAWCAAFVYWCFAEAATRLKTANPAPKLAGVHDCWQEAQLLGAHAQSLTPDQIRANPGLVVPGAVFFMDRGHGLGHTGIVAEMIDGRPITIEGNTYGYGRHTGSREGDGVYRLTHRRLDDFTLGCVIYS